MCMFNYSEFSMVCCRDFIENAHIEAFFVNINSIPHKLDSFTRFYIEFVFVWMTFLVCRGKLRMNA